MSMSMCADRSKCSASSLATVDLPAPGTPEIKYTAACSRPGSCCAGAAAAVFCALCVSGICWGIYGAVTHQEGWLGAGFGFGFIGGLFGPTILGWLMKPAASARIRQAVASQAMAAAGTGAPAWPQAVVALRVATLDLLNQNGLFGMAAILFAGACLVLFARHDATLEEGGPAKNAAGA